MGRIVKINSMNLVVSLPCQMVGYVSINEISRPLSKIIANIADSEEDDEDEKENDENILPELSSLFKIGQWVRCKVSRIETPDDKKATSKHWRVHLTLVPDEVNSDIISTDLSKGMVFINKNIYIYIFFRSKCANHTYLFVSLGYISVC